MTDLRPAHCPNCAADLGGERASCPACGVDLLHGSEAPRNVVSDRAAGRNALALGIGCLAVLALIVLAAVLL